MVNYELIEFGSKVFNLDGDVLRVFSKKNNLIACCQDGLLDLFNSNDNNISHISVSWYQSFELFYNDTERLLFNFRNNLEDLLNEAFELELPNIQTEVKNIYKKCEDINKQTNENGN